MRAFVRRGLRPGSPAAFGFAVLCVAAGTLARFAIDMIAPQAVPFATYFPAVLIATLIGGLTAGIFAAVLSGGAAWWLFMPPRTAWDALTSQDLVSVALFLLVAATIVWIAAQYRRLVRRLDEAEHYRQFVVDELSHRVKNKLATVYAILRHELRGHRDIWTSVAGRLRALSAADDFIIKSHGEGIALRQILKAELAPYGSATIALQGCEVLVHDKLAVALALVFHELVTNAAKYGALSSPNGRIDIAWHLDNGDIKVDWIERGGPAVSPPTRRSFGSQLIERSLDSLGGRAKIDFAASGIVCRLSFPRLRDAESRVAEASLVA